MACWAVVAIITVGIIIPATVSSSVVTATAATLFVGYNAEEIINEYDYIASIASLALWILQSC